MNAPLEQAVRFFTQETDILACISIVCASPERRASALGGVTDLNGTPVTADSVFDLASLTKLFTSLTLMRLVELGEIDLTRPVSHYAPCFQALNGATLDEVLGFEVNLQTPERIDAQPNREAGLIQLEAAVATPQTGTRFYSDIHAMVIGRVIEEATGEPLYDVMKQLLLDLAGMQETWAHVPESVRPRCVSCEREHRLERGRYILREEPPRGLPHDPKARLMQGADGRLSGHAGLFATIGDLEKLMQALLGGRLVSTESLRLMARNRLGRQLPDGRWTQHLGSLCYVKHPVQRDSEVPRYMSDHALALSGFTGHHISVDPTLGLYTICLGNRVLNRLTVLIPEEGRTLMNYGLHPDGTGRLHWPDGTWVSSSVDYVHQKDQHLHHHVTEALGLNEYPAGRNSRV